MFRLQFDQALPALFEAQMGAHPSQHLHSRHGFGDVVNSAGLKSLYFRRHILLGGDEQDRRGRGGRIGLQCTADVESATVGEVDVQQDQIGMLLGDAFESSGHACGRGGLKAGASENTFEYGNRGRIVIHDENQGWTAPRRLLFIPHAKAPDVTWFPCSLSRAP